MPSNWLSLVCLVSFLNECSQESLVLEPEYSETVKLTHVVPLDQDAAETDTQPVVYYEYSRGSGDLAPLDESGKAISPSESKFEPDVDKSLDKSIETDFDSKEGLKNVDYPVKTTRKFKDANGNIKVVTTYSNKNEDSPASFKSSFDDDFFTSTEENKATQKQQAQYKKRPFVTKRVEHPPPKLEVVRMHPDQIKAIAANSQRVHHFTPARGSRVEFRSAHPQPPPQAQSQLQHQPKPIIQVAPYKQATLQATPKAEYGKVKTIRFPAHSGELVSHHSHGSKDGKGGYNQQAAYKETYQLPKVKVETITVPVKKIAPVAAQSKTVSSQPLQEAGSSLSGGYVDGGDIDGDISSDVADDHYIGGGGGYGTEKGGHYAAGHKAAHGSKGEKAFKTKENYDKGHSENHGHAQKKGKSKEESSHKKGHLDEANKYAEGHALNKGKKHNEVKSSKGHKKGHKKKGFRTVHHKDEYKKDEVFYDEEHDLGEVKKQHEDLHQHKKAEGGNAKKGHLSKGYSDTHKGYHGEKEEGHNYQNKKGHNAQQGHKGHHDHYSKYGKKAAQHEGEKHGHLGGYF